MSKKLNESVDKLFKKNKKFLNTLSEVSEQRFNPYRHLQIRAEEVKNITYKQNGHTHKVMVLGYKDHHYVDLAKLGDIERAAVVRYLEKKEQEEEYIK
jgi:hypothetical protein